MVEEESKKGKNERKLAIKKALEAEIDLQNKHVDEIANFFVPFVENPEKQIEPSIPEEKQNNELNSLQPVVHKKSRAQKKRVFICFGIFII